VLGQFAHICFPSINIYIFRKLIIRWLSVVKVRIISHYTFFYSRKLQMVIVSHSFCISTFVDPQVIIWVKTADNLDHIKVHCKMSSQVSIRLVGFVAVMRLSLTV